MVINKMIIGKSFETQRKALEAEHHPLVQDTTDSDCIATGIEIQDHQYVLASNIIQNMHTNHHLKSEFTAKRWVGSGQIRNAALLMLKQTSTFTRKNLRSQPP